MKLKNCKKKKSQILKFVYKGKLLKSGTLEHNLIKDGGLYLQFNFLIS